MLACFRSPHAKTGCLLTAAVAAAGVAARNPTKYRGTQRKSARASIGRSYCIASPNWAIHACFSVSCDYSCSAAPISPIHQTETLRNSSAVSGLHACSALRRRGKNVQKMLCSIVCMEPMLGPFAWLDRRSSGLGSKFLPRRDARLRSAESDDGSRPLSGHGRGGASVPQWE